MLHVLHLVMFMHKHHFKFVYGVEKLVFVWKQRQWDCFKETSLDSSLLWIATKTAKVKRCDMFLSPQFLGNEFIYHFYIQKQGWVDFVFDLFCISLSL